MGSLRDGFGNFSKVLVYGAVGGYREARYTPRAIAHEAYEVEKRDGNVVIVPRDVAKREATVIEITYL